MNGWGRVGGVLLAVGLAAAATGCGQLFTQSGGSPSMAQLSSRVDSMDAQMAELQAAMANMGQGTTAPGTASTTAASTAAGNQSSGVVQSDLPIAVVEADVLNVRDDPSLTGTIKGTLLQNARVNVLANQGNWSEISFSNPAAKVSLTGWVDSDYLGPAQGSAAANSATSATSATGAAPAAASGTTAGSSVSSAY